jgi:CopG family nickel-responsive transcriptional regulator
MTVKRFGVSLEDDLLEDLDQYVRENNFPNRSQAIRSLIEKNIVEKKWLCNNEVGGAIVLMYDHHKHDINNKAADIQHQHHHLILATQHIHLDHNNCLETIMVRGKANELTDLANKIVSLKGIKHGKLVMSRTD